MSFPFILQHERRSVKEPFPHMSSDCLENCVSFLKAVLEKKKKGKSIMNNNMNLVIGPSNFLPNAHRDPLRVGNRGSNGIWEL